MMLSISWEMTLIAVLILPITVFVVSKIAKKSQKYFKAQQDHLGYLDGQVEEIYGGHLIVKAFNAEEKVSKAFDEENNNLYRSGWKSQFLSGLMHPIMNFIGNIAYVGVAILGGYLAAQGQITVGNIQSFIQYSKNFTNPISQLAQISSLIQSMIAASERVFNFLELDEYFLKKRKKFTISIGLKLTDFQYNVLLETLKIPYGKISTYSDIAKVISNKRGFINRAVAKVESQNPIAILIPCHRVVAKNMMLGGYFYGLDKKEYLLSNEGVNIFNKKIVL